MFAPTNEAFAQLPQPILDQLMQADNRDELKTLLRYHVIEGKEIKAEQAIGATATERTLADDDIEVDGTGEMIVLIPTGMTIVQTAEGPMVRRRALAMAAPAIEVGEPEQAGQQQQAMQGHSQAGEGAGGQAGASGSTAAQQHAQGTARDDRGETLGQMKTAAGGSGELGDAMVVEPDIEADNGVIHGINSVLIPQQVAGNLDMQGLPGQGGQSRLSGQGQQGQQGETKQHGSGSAQQGKGAQSESQ